MNNEPKTVGRPCPWCGGAGYQNDYLVSTGHVACDRCFIELPVEAWDTLSDAAELARAVERLGEHIPVMGGVSFNKPDGAQFQASIISGLGWHVTISAQSPLCDTPDAALIALAEQVNDASK